MFSKFRARKFANENSYREIQAKVLRVIFIDISCIQIKPRNLFQLCIDIEIICYSLQMLFGDTEIKASAMDVGSKQTVRAYVDFLNESNPKYITKM